MQLNGKTVVLTGAASGIGQALAFQLYEMGCHLALVDRDAQGLARVEAQLSGKSAKVTTHVVDLAERAATCALVDEVLAQHTKIHVLINNAGVALGGTFDKTPAADFDWLMRINFGAIVDLTRGFLPGLTSQTEQTCIVFISSLFGLIAPPEQTAYCASKFAVRGFANALRHELAETDVGVLVVHPGGINTSIANNAKIAPGIPEEEVEQRRKEINKMLKMPPGKAAKQIIDAVQANRVRLLVGSDAKLLSLIERIMPARYWPLVDKLMRLGS